MRTTRRLFLALVAAALLAGSWSGPRAEVANDRRLSDTPSTIVMAIVEGSDPIGSAAWLQVRPVDSPWMLNVDGYDRGDGRPDIVFRPGNQWPVVVWAYRNPGLDHDIALSQWTDAGWSATAFLTADLGDDLDPRAFVRSDGTIDVVWWTAGDADGNPDRVVLSTREPVNASFGVATPVTGAGQEGRRPSVAWFGGSSWVAYERTSDLAGATQEVVVARRDNTGGGFAIELVVPTSRAGRLDPILHVAGGHMWLDWIHGDGQLGHTELGSDGWLPIEVDAFNDTSWIGEETARKTVPVLSLRP